MWYFRLNKSNCQVTYPNTFEIVFAELSVGKDNSFRFPVRVFFFFNSVFSTSVVNASPCR